MIDLAKNNNKYPGRCQYIHYQGDDLKSLTTQAFDFVCSLLVLQHNSSEYAQRYIAEFVRVLNPGGLLVFQVPSGLRPQALRDGPFSACERELPREACQADIKINLDGDLFLAPGERLCLPVSATNAGILTWPAGGRPDGRYQLKVGNRWLSEKDSIEVLDDGRAILGTDLAPGDTANFDLWITAPLTAGTYTLEVDMVQEMVTWFASKGSEACRIPVQVGSLSPAQALESTRRTAINSIKMNGLSVGHVVNLIEDCGGQVETIEADNSAGREWHSYCYYVTR